MRPAIDRQGVQPKLQGKRVLIVDDNATNRRILSLQTRSWGMMPCETGSPSAALAWLERGDPFEVAFLDLHMSEMDGIELSAEIRKLRSERQLPLVMLTLRRQAYDVVLMDIQMPEMDGLEATRAIWREWPGEGRPRILAMTANATREDRAACLAAGTDDYLSKPIVVEDLVAALSRCRTNPSLAGAPSRSPSVGE